jgi:hypothetical protein
LTTVLLKKTNFITLFVIQITIFSDHRREDDKTTRFSLCAFYTGAPALGTEGT